MMSNMVLVMRSRERSHMISLHSGVSLSHPMGSAKSALIVEKVRSEPGNEEILRAYHHSPGVGDPDPDWI